MRWLTRKILKSIDGKPSRSYQNGTRLRLEAMEDRLAPAVVTLSVNATHSFVSQLAAANPGDTLQIEPGAILGTLGTTGSTTTAANNGNTTIAVNAVFAPGQIIAISHSGDTTETALIDAVSGPTGGVYTLTLHEPLADNHQSGSTATAIPNTMGIGKGITIQGDPIDAPSSLLSGTTLEYFTQNGTPFPDALSHLSLTAVEGTTSSNLSITGTTFNIPTGITDAINVVSDGTLTISSDTFTIGSSAHLVTVVSGQTGAGAITFTGDTITASSLLGSNAVALTSSSGPISVTSFSLTASGSIGGDGLNINTSGDATVAGTNKINVTGAVTGSALDINSGAAASITNVTVLLSSDAGADGINASSVSGNLTASNLNVTVDGSVMGNSADGAAIDLDATGNATVSNLTALVQHTAKYGLFVEADGNLSISGAEKATVTGSVADDGIYIYASDGAVTVSTSLSVTLGSSADYGLYLEASSGSLTDTGAITVNVTGAVTNTGAYLYGGTSLSVAAVSATLGSTASYGVDIEGYTATVNGAVIATVTGAVGNDGVDIESYYGPLTINSSVTSKLSSSTKYGVYLYGEENNLLIHSPITANITGAVSEVGLYAYGADDTTIGAKVQVTIGGAAVYGVEIEADEGTLNDTAGVNVSITGAVTDDAAYFYSTAAATVSNVTVTASDIASGEGIYFETEDGGNGLTATNLNVTANNGSSSAYGVSLYSYYGGPIAASDITVNMNAAADYGLYVYSEYASKVSLSNVSVNITGAASYGVYEEQYYSGGGTSLTNVTATIGGAASDGIYVSDDYNGTMTLSGVSATLKSTADYGIYAYGYGGAVIDGSINASVTGAVSDYGVYIYTYYSDLTITSPIKVNLGSTAEYGLYAETADGNLTDTAGVNVSITGAVTDEGAYFYSSGAATVANVSVTASDIASGEGLYIETEDGGDSLTATNLNVTANNGTSSAYGVDLYTEYGGPITASGITVNMNAAADYGLYVYSEYASKVSLSNVSVNITGAASYGVYEEQYYSGGGTSLTNVTTTIGGAASDGIYVSDEYNGTMTLSGVSATLKSTADYGIYAYSYGGAVINGALNSSVTGAVTNYGVYIYSEYSDIAIASPITVHLGSTAVYGLYVDAGEGSLVDTVPATVIIAGNVTDDGAYLYSNVNLTLAANLTVTVGGTASAAAYLESEYGSVTDTAGMTLSVTGQISSGGDGLYAYGDTGDTIDNVQITLKNGSAGYGAYIDGSEGSISVNNLKLNVTGAVTDDGLYIYTDGNITTSAVSVNLSSTAEYGIYADSHSSNLAMTTTTDSVGGALTDYGAYLYAESAESISHLNVALASTSEYALYAESEYDNLSVANLSLSESGLASSEGAFLESHWGNLSFANSTIAMNGGLTNPSADYAVQVETPFGNTAINADKITVKGSAEAGLTTTANGSMKLTNTTITTGGGNALLLNGSSGNPQTIENNTLSTTGTGTGLAFGGGDLVVALVQGNNFVSNLVGVAITGDGTNAGNIDLGGGLLGSTGKNNFSGFTSTSNHYALTLASTSATSTVYALGNTFSVVDPNTVVQDAAHNGGTGIIDV